jgi:DNA-binding GntR family transcriptional regulator
MSPSERGQQASARDTVLAVLRQRIVSSELPPGAPVREKDLAQELGVSRTPLRESLIILSGEGLVRVFPQLGTFVTPIDVDRVAHAQFVREALEAASLRVAFDNANSFDHAEIAAILDKQDAAIEARELDRFIRLDDLFHERLMQASGHESAWREVSAAKVHMDRVRKLSLPMPNVLARLVREHRAIADALRTGDRDGGLAALHTHLTGVFDDIENIRAKHPQHFASIDARPVRTVTTVLSPT